MIRKFNVLSAPLGPPTEPASELTGVGFRVSCTTYDPSALVKKGRAIRREGPQRRALRLEAFAELLLRRA